MYSTVLVSAIRKLLSLNSRTKLAVPTQSATPKAFQLVNAM